MKKDIKREQKVSKREVFRRVSAKERDWVASKNFLNSGVWKRLAYDAREQNLKLFGSVCMVCGRKGGHHGSKLNVDHIYPRSRFPQLACVLENLQLLCPDCNEGKGNRSTTDWRQIPPIENTNFIPTKTTRRVVAEIAPDYDIENLVERYWTWSKNKPPPDKPQSAFIGWVKKFTHYNERK